MWLGFVVSFLTCCDGVFMCSQLVLAEADKSVREMAGKQQMQFDSKRIPFLLSSSLTVHVTPEVTGKGHTVFGDSSSLIPWSTGGS